MVQHTLYQINTRVWLHERGQQLGRPATLADIPDAFLDRLASLGFDWVWLLGIWQTGPAGRAVSLANPDWQQEYRALLADFTDEDVCGAPFAVQQYAVHSDFGGGDALRDVRRRMQERGLRLLLDFVPNHTALDHPWVREHPDFYIAGSTDDLAREPENYEQVETRLGPVVLAHGRDPYFPGWPDTLQLNYRHPQLRSAMLAELLNIAAMCDGVRCDMAMLLLPHVIARTWGDRSRPRDGSSPVEASFWPEALAHVRQEHPDFLWMAEVYWDLEWTLQQQGFAFTYDKRLYDRLHHGDAAGVRGHLLADLDFQNKSVRFLENHDEPRAAAHFAGGMAQAAAVITYFTPGLRFFHEGQLEGRRRKASLHLRRRPAEPIDPALEAFHARLLRCLKRPELSEGRWQLLNCRQAWDGNPTSERFVGFIWHPATSSTGQRRLLIVVNYGPTHGQCYVPLPFADLQGKSVLLRDLMNPPVYERAGDYLVNRGLYLDLPPWGYHVFDMKTHEHTS